MATNKDILFKGVRNLLWSIPLLFLGPTIIHNAFMNKENNWHYLVLFLGIFVCLTSVFLIFTGLKKIMKSLFHD